MSLAVKSVSKYWSAILASTECWHICHCIFLWNSLGSGVQEQQCVPSCALAGAARRGHWLTAHPLECQPQASPTPAPVPGCSRTLGPDATPSSSPSQPARLTSALGLTRPEYRRIRFKTPVLPYTMLEPSQNHQHKRQNTSADAA